MTRVTTSDASDDEFDMVGDIDTVSGGVSAQYNQNRLSIPSLRLACEPPAPSTGTPPAAQLDESPLLLPDSTPGELNELAADLANNSLDDSHRGSNGHAMHGGVGGDKSGSTSGHAIPGSQYTRSMYQKLVGEKEALIAVMGMTGSGKTTFISKVTGRDDLEIGHNLTSCTREIQVIATKLNGQTVHFVDTPGFSDTTLSDTQVLQMIADYLAAAYHKQLKLSGIIYLHPISDTRMTHHGTKNLDMFRKLTGEKNLKNVVLATSMWDKVSSAEGETREQELKTKFWKILLALQARTARHDGSEASARALAATLLANKPFYLQLQEEMGKDNKALRDTAAGQEVMLAISRIKDEHKRELAEMERIMRGSAEESLSVVEALKEQYQERLGELESTLRDERRMNEEAVRSLTERIKALEERGPCIVM